MEDSVFITKYNEFVEDLFGALPEYKVQIQAAKDIDDSLKLAQFQEHVKVKFEDSNPGMILPGVDISDTVWNALSENTQKAIQEYVRILSISSFMESGSKPEWANAMNGSIDDMMNELKNKMENVDFQNIINKFMTFLKPDANADANANANANANADAKPEAGGMPGFEKFFENGFPKMPERFLKGHMAKLAQEIVKDITPEDLGISKEMMDECEKTPSRAFDILFKVFGNNPEIIQKTIQKIGKRLQEKIASGSIKPQEIAREAEELMKEFSENSGFVNMMDGIKKAFGFEDMDMAKKAGKEGSARLSIARERLRKKMAQKDAKSSVPVNPSDVSKSDAVMASLLKDESRKKLPRKGKK